MSIEQNDVEAFMTAKMQEQQTELLRLAAKNTDVIMAQNIKESNSAIKDVIDDEVEGCSTWDGNFKNNINKSNYDFCKQVEDMWKKTGKAIEEENVPKAMNLIEKGKKLTKNRLKALRIADKEGWDTSLAYLSDDLTSCSEENSLKKARCVVQTNREKS